MKICSKCGLTKPSEEFYRGLGQCRVCKAAYVALWQKVNYPTRLKAYRAAWRKKNRDKVKASKAAWRKKNPAGVRAHKVIRRARTRAAVIGDTRALARFLRWIRTAEDLVCYWCKRVTESVDRHADHVVPLSRGGPHSVENLVCACADCNRAKTNLMPEEWIKKLQLRVASTSTIFPFVPLSALAAGLTG